LEPNRKLFLVHLLFIHHSALVGAAGSLLPSYFLSLVVLQQFFQEYLGSRAAGPSVSSVVFIHASLHDVVIGVYGALNAT